MQLEREASERENLTFSPKLNPKSLSMVAVSKVHAGIHSSGPASPSASSPSPGGAGAVGANEFKPTINANSKRLSQQRAQSAPVHERLYEAAAARRGGVAAGDASPERGERARREDGGGASGARAPQVVHFTPDLAFVVETLRRVEG